MSQSIVASRGFVITRRTVRSLRISNIHSETKKRKRRTFNDIIWKNIGDSVTKPTSPNARENVSYSDVVEPYSAQLPEDNDPVMPDRTAVFEKPTTNHLIHSELRLYQGELLRKAKVFGRNNEENGDATDSYDPTPFLNTFTYEVEFSDNNIKDFSDNVIVENTYS